MATLYSNQSSNTTKTWLLMTSFLVVVILFGFLVSYFYQSSAILYGAIIFSLLMNFASYFFSDKIVLSMAGARRIEKKEDYPELWNLLENLSITAGLPMPKLYVIDDPAPNAFATGRNKNHAVVAVTTGLLPLLNKSELEGVLAHELAHINNKDILLQTVVVVLVGFISIVADLMMRMSMFGGKDNKNPIMLVFVVLAAVLAPLAGTIIQLAISRKREFLADSTGALLTRYPEGLASALQKISSFPKNVERANHATAHLYISDPFAHNLNQDGTEEEPSWFAKLFMTHPPVKERVAALLNKESK